MRALSRSLFAALLLLAVLWPAAARAQYVSVAGQPWSQRFSFEPYLGAYFDNADDRGAFTDSGLLGGVRIGFLMSDRFHLLGDVGYARGESAFVTSPADEIGGESVDLWLATGGFELEVVPGETAGLLGLQGGAVWRSTGSESTVVVPGVAIRQRLGPRADVRVGLQDYIFLRDNPVTHNFALTAGLSLR